jgi:hypothetical protein
MKNLPESHLDMRKLRHITDEKWKFIPGTKNLYMISNYGRVKSFCGNPEGKLLKQSETKGFKTVCIRVDGKRKTVLVHKLTAESFLEKSTDHDMVVHLDWNKGNNNYKNLKWVNRNEGYERILTRLHERNRNNPRKRKVTNSKLEIKDIEVLKSMLERGVKQKVIAQLFCISEMQVSRIKRGENWGQVKTSGANN